MNFVNIDAPYNLQYYKEGIPDTEIATMGCVDGKETIIYRYNEGIYQESFKEFADRILNDLPINIYSSNSTYVNTDGIVDIYDSNSESFVNCKKLIININVKDWVKLTISDTITIDCTIDHPLPIYEVVDEDITSVRMRADEVSIGDKILLSNYNSMSVDTFGTITNIEFYTANKYSYDVETESDRFDVSGINSHNCRTRVIGDVTDPDNQIVTGRGNLSFTSINLPRLAIEANHDINKFYELLDHYLDLCRDELLFRFKIQCNKTIKNYPFLMGQGVWIGSENLGIDEHLDEVLKHGTLSIGFVGLAETLISLIGKHHGESDEAQQLGLEIIGHMRDYTDRMSEKYHLNFSVLATPAESLAGRFAKINRALFGEIKGVTDNGYLTNSNHIPVYYNISAYDKIKKEAPYHALCNAGHICYIELDGDPTENLDAFEKVVRCMHDEGIGYGAINHPVDRDPVCGYVGIIGDVCPCCGRHEGEALTPEAYRNIIAKKRLDSHYGEA